MAAALSRRSNGPLRSHSKLSCHSTEIERFELGLKFSNVERKNSGAFFGENVPTAPMIRNQECTDTQLYYDIRDSDARRRHPCGMSFNAEEFLEKHPQYDWLEGYLEDMPGQEWHLCKIDEGPSSGSREK